MKYPNHWDREKQGDTLDVYARARLNNYWNLGLSGYLRRRGLADGAVVSRRASSRAG